MGLKTNKSTKTSRLTCQYVGSFPVKDKNDKKLTSSEQNKFVVEKLKSCKKKLITGMPVILEVSPDGIRVLGTDEKTIKMGHSLRRVSYATAEATNKLFAYVSHQPEDDIELVCHTFLTKKKDHAEGLSAALGKLFKQTFAYTLKRRDKLEEAAQKRGANRRWAKQQVGEGHGVSEHAKNAARQEKPRRNKASESEQQKSTAMDHKIPSDLPPPTSQNTSSQPLRPDPVDHFSTTTSARSEVVPVQVHTAAAHKLSAPSSNDQPPPLPERNGPAALRSLFREATPENGGYRQTNQEQPNKVSPPLLPKRNGTPSQSDPFDVTPPQSPDESAPKERKFSAPAGSIPASPSNVTATAQRRSSTDLFTEQVSPTWLKTTAPQPAGMEEAASSLLSGVGTVPPSLPRRNWETFEEPEVIAEEVFDDDKEEDERNVPIDRRVSVTLEEEDWYIPGVTREYVIEILETSDMGTFFVRDSQSVPGCYALTMKVIQGSNNPTGFGHYLIMPSENGFALQGFEKEFPDISSLIRHHASFEDGLPCRLILAGSNPLFHDSNGYLVEFMDEEDDTYASLSNCSSMFNELKLNGNTVPW